MPELPEVEVTRRYLNQRVKAEKIHKVVIIDGALRFNLDMSFANALKGRTIRTIKRRGKYLLFNLDDAKCMIAHLGMTGNIMLNPSPKHDRVIFELDHHKMFFNDVRKFGFLLLKKQDELDNYFKHMGPDALSSAFNISYVNDRFAAFKNRSIKSILLDQKFVAGIGNIYANEILYMSLISPFRKVSDIDNSGTGLNKTSFYETSFHETGLHGMNLHGMNLHGMNLHETSLHETRFHETNLLIKNIILVLNKAIAKGGSSFSDFKHPDGSRGYFKMYWQVYQREHQRCNFLGNCPGIIVKEQYQGRSTYFCPVHQI